ncbi:MAG: TonB-dependent copper receptor [Bacterioplanes sp.]|nr:TonB-dependent copper receptor [Bacterioplanes sp.]
MRRHPLTLAITLASLSSLPVIAETTHESPAKESPAQLQSAVVIAPQMGDVLRVSTDPKAPRQPVPAHDGADLLKNIPGFSVIRKGGTDGDPVFRGMAASRLSILLDGEMIHGGCGMRMDPPTAYVFPEAYEEVVILKGPQTVKHGPGNSAGVVMFERHQPDFSDRAIQGHASATLGSFGRNDQVGKMLLGGEQGYIELSGTRSDANNYQDGNGNDVHSAYTRWSSNAALGWTPNRDTVIELSAARSDGEARYGDRGMDGSKFARENLSLRYQQNNLTPWLAQVRARVYRNYIDHVMDNYSLRTPPMMQMVSNPDRDTTGASVSAVLTPTVNSEWEMGVDQQKNHHTSRRANSPTSSGVKPDYRSQPRTKNMAFDSLGVFAEWTYHLPGNHSWHTGARLNRDEAKDLRSGRDTSGSTDTNTLRNGFVRYEHQWDEANRVYIGLGHSERAADFWERNKQTAPSSTFDLDTEKTTQWDVGILHKSERINASLSAFYTQHRDFILITNAPNDARNIRATSYGAEADASIQLFNHWTLMTAAAWVHGSNDSDNMPLGQISPAEARLGLTYDNQRWSAGALWRLVDDQNRVAVDTGNIVGQDIGKTPGFTVFSLHAGYRPHTDVLLTAGIDNLFDITYAEHLSRGGVDIGGYETTTRINEPGRNVWLKAQWQF